MDLKCWGGSVTWIRASDVMDRASVATDRASVILDKANAN